MKKNFMVGLFDHKVAQRTFTKEHEGALCTFVPILRVPSWLILCVPLWLTLLPPAFSQQRIDSLEVRLERLSKEVPGLNQKIELSVSNMPLDEFVRNIANLTRLNINLGTKRQQQVTNNFVNVDTKDVLLFLSKYFNLDIQLTGSIIHITDYVPEIPPRQTKKLKISYDKAQQRVSLDLKNDSLYLFSKQITQLTGSNVIFEPDLAKKTVSVYVENLPLQQALDRMAIANNLEVARKDETWILQSMEQEAAASVSTRSRTSSRQTGGAVDYTLHNKEHIDIYGDNLPIHATIEAISKKLKLNYFILAELNGNANLHLTNVTYDEFLEHILRGTTYAAVLQKGIYLFGNRAAEGIRQTRVLNLQYRSVSELSKLIPESLTREVKVQEFPDLNSLILSGSAPGINEVAAFIEQIDKVVPLIMIEVMIIDNQSGYTIETGITAGIGEEPAKSSGQLYPGTDYRMGDRSVNALINSFNGFGALNLGRVTPNFYLDIKALEEQGLVKVRSTPKLSTLNGHTAELTIGNTEYYVEQLTDFIVTQSTQQRTTIQYKDVKAEFKLSVTPFVDGNDQITMNVIVEQEDFTARLDDNAPPGKVSRKFNSMIRVKNEETVLLGGLEEKTDNNSGSGLPLLSRIPVLKWIFSKRVKSKNENKLNIFIKPTIIH